MNDEGMAEIAVEELVASIRVRLLEAYQKGKTPDVEMHVGTRERATMGGFVEHEPDGSWELRVSIPPDADRGD